MSLLATVQKLFTPATAAEQLFDCIRDGIFPATRNYYAQLCAMECLESAKKIVSENGPEILNARDEDGNTPLLLALSRYRDSGLDRNMPRTRSVWSLIELLVASGSDITATNNHGEIVSNLISDTGMYDLERRLCENGFDPTDRPYPIQHIINSSRPTEYKQTLILHAIKHNTADINEVLPNDPQHRTALRISIDDEEMAIFLVGLGARLNTKDKDCFEALCFALNDDRAVGDRTWEVDQHFNLALALLGSDKIDLSDSDPKRASQALSHLVESMLDNLGDKSTDDKVLLIAKILCERGADPREPNTSGVSPLTIVERYLNENALPSPAANMYECIKAKHQSLFQELSDLFKICVERIDVA